MEIQAVITKLVKDRGFGFAEDEFKQLYFFHYSAIDPRVSLEFNSLNVGNRISFNSEPTDRGPRAKPRTLRLVTIN